MPRVVYFYALEVQLYQFYFVRRFVRSLQQIAPLRPCE